MLFSILHVSLYLMRDSVTLVHVYVPSWHSILHEILAVSGLFCWKGIFFYMVIYIYIYIYIYWLSENCTDSELLSKLLHIGNNSIYNLVSGFMEGVVVYLVSCRIWLVSDVRCVLMGSCFEKMK